MRKRFFAAVSMFFILIFGSAFARSGISLSFGGNVGAYTLPGEISGYIDGSASTSNRYIWAESSTDQYGYIQQTYKYKHPIPSRTLPNTGLHFQIAYTFPSRIGFFFEGCRSCCIVDKEINNSVPV
jgi:hypothetical protein